MSKSKLFRILTAVILMLFVGHRAYYNRKYPPKDMDTIDSQGNSMITIVASIFAILALIATLFYLFAPNLIIRASIPFLPSIRWIGLFLALLGFALLEWSHRALSSN